MGEITLGKYIKMMEDGNPQDAYKIFEKYGKKFDLFRNDPHHCSYWMVCGETIQYYGTIILFESKDSLSKKVSQQHPEDAANLGFKQHRPAIFEIALHEVYRDSVLRNMPSECSQCGFHRFFGLKIDETSLGQDITIFCPSCKKEFGTIDGDSGDYIEKDENTDCERV